MGAKLVRIGLTLVLVSFLLPVRTEAEPATAPAKLIQIEAEIIEIDDNKALELGIRWEDIFKGIEMATGSAMEYAYAEGPGTESRTIATYKFDEAGRGKRLTPISAEVKALEDLGVLRILSKPRLITKDGTTATSLTGGEIPYPIPQEEGTITLEWKEYGVKLEIKPTVTAQGRVDTQVKAEVRELDYSVTLEVSGIKVPGFLTRTAETQVVVKDGETIAISGLTRTRKEKTTTGIPGMSRIPGLGLLFGRTKWETKKLNVVIFITPTIVTEASATVE